MGGRFVRRRWLRIPKSPGAQTAEDVDREVSFHLESRIDDLVGRGMSREDAEREARREFGDDAAWRARLRRESAKSERRRRWLEGFSGRRLDLRLALRRLRREPGFTLIGGSTLAVGIGATVAIFAILNAVLLRPLPFPEPDGLVSVNHTAPGFGVEHVPQATGTYFTYREDARTLEDLAVWQPDRLTVTGLAEPEEVEGLLVTEGFLPLLRVRLALGRGFGAEDVAPGGPLTTILSNRYWRERLGGSTDVIGRTVHMDGRDWEIIGVLPEGFRFLDRDPAFLLPFQFDRAEARVTDFSYEGLGRLAPGANVDAAVAEMDRLLRLAPERFPEGLTVEMLEQGGVRAVIRPLKDVWVGDIRRALWILFGAAGLVLAIAAANVAGLFLVRAERRQQEMTVQLSLGASRARAARTYVIESLLFSLLGAAAGLLLAWLGTTIVTRIGPENLPRLRDVGIGWTEGAAALIIALVLGAVLGTIPVLRLRATELATSLRSGGRGGSRGIERHRAQNALVVSQIAIALVTLIGSGLMLRSFQALRNVEPGFDHDRPALTFRLAIPGATVPSIEAAAAQFESIERALESIPGIEEAAFVSRLPMDAAQAPEDMLVAEDFPLAEGELPPIRRFKWVSGDYFETMGVPIVAGRAIDPDDIRGRRPVAVISENIAIEHWGAAASAIGKRVRNDSGGEGPWREIVGVAASVRDDGLDREPVDLVYWPMVVERFWGSEVFAQRSGVFVLRGPRIGAPGLVEDVQTAVWSVNRDLPLASVQTLDEVLRGSLTNVSFTLIVLGLAAAIALFLGAVGLYAVISYAVSTRTREIGVRMALGADAGAVARMVLRSGLGLAAVGVGLGIALALGLTRLMETLLFGVRPVDAITYAGTALLLATIAAFASWLPARRAARVDPQIALRHD